MNNKEKSDNNEIVIDISTTNARIMKEQEYFLQQRAFTKVTNLLEKELNTIIEKDQSLNGQRTHNSIFINGSRGSGKTQFLLNIQKFLENSDKINNKKNMESFIFIDSIDPTLLHQNESFLTIILAKILNRLEKDNTLRRQEKKQQEFYSLLSNVAQAIDGIYIKEDKRTSLEKISQDQTSLQLEEYIHQFFRLVTDLVDKKHIVLLIDDVDMAFDKGFTVLEVVRKYLSSPYIIPIITGDKHLYRKLVFNHFSNKVKDNNEKNEDTDERCDKYHSYCSTTELASAYLTKVLPLHRRVNLKTVYELAQYNKIKFEYKGKVQWDLALKSEENNNDFFYQRANELFVLENARNKFVKNLFTNPLRNIKEYFHAKYDAKLGLYNLQDAEEELNIQFKGKNKKQEHIKDELEKLKEESLKYIQKIEKKYNLQLLEGVLTWRTYLDEGLKYFQNNEWQKAIENFDQSIKLKPSYEAYFSKGNAHSNSKDSEKAIEAYETAINIDDKKYQAFVNLGMNLYHTKSRNVLQVLQKAYSLNAYDNLTHFYLALVYKDNQQWQNSIKFFQKAIEGNYLKDDIYLKLSEVYIQTKDYQKAQETIEIGISLNPNSSKYYAVLGLIYYNLSDYNQSIEAYEKASELNPKDLFIRRKLANSYYNLGQQEQDMRLYQQSIKILTQVLDSSNDKEILQELKVIFLHVLESYLIDDESESFINLSKEFLIYFEHTPKNMKIYNMLTFLYKAGVYYEEDEKKLEELFNEWRTNYDIYNEHWDFDELEKWNSKNIHIQKYIKAFKYLIQEDEWETIL